MPKVEVSPGPSLPTTFDARISQPQAPTPSVMPPVALVEIETAAELIPGPRGSLWYTGTGAPTSFPGQANGDMYLDNATDHVWQLQSGTWVDTGTDLHGSPDTPADILAKLVTVDGPGSSLDADLLDGQHAVFFASQAALDAEATARGSADSTLQGNITSEASTRASADTTLQSNIDAEVTNRTNADAALQTQINTKVDATAQDTRDDGQDAAIAIKIGEAPNDGQQYARQSLGWAAVAIPPGTIMQDTPPSSPQPGQFWYDTDSGGLYLWFNDGTSSQWIQVGGGPAQGFGAVGEEYAMTATGWRLKSQTIDLNGIAFATGKAVPVPTGAKLMKFAWDVGKVDATAYIPSIRLSVDGTTFLSGATDYAYAGNYMASNATAVSGIPPTSTPQMPLSVPHQQAAYSVKGQGVIRVSRPALTIPFGGFMQGNAIQSVYYQTIYQFYMNSAAVSSVLAFKAVSFGAHGYSGTFLDGSMFDVEWVY